MKEKKLMKKFGSSVMAAVIASGCLCTSALIPATAVDLNSVCINEVCAKNTSYAAPDGNFYDWIELYNPTGSAVDLAGYGLTDKASNPYKYTFPENSVIQAKDRLLVFCDSAITPIDGAYTAAFGLSTSGETLTLTAPDGNIADTLTFGSISADVSYGRYPDGTDSFAGMNTTPGAANNVVTVDVAEPVFSVPGGFYDDGFSLQIEVPQGTTVYYTLDGSAPTTSSQKYTGAINVSDPSNEPNKLSAHKDIAPDNNFAPKNPVNKAFIINAIAVDQSGNVSDVAAAAYFIGYQNRDQFYKDFKIISITTDEDNLFDYEKGIYVMGKTYDDWKNSSDYKPNTNSWEIPANYNQRGKAWERPATMQIYKEGELVHSQGVGLRVHGGASRSNVQKSFNVYARGDYGAAKFDFNLFSGNVRSESTGKKIKEFDSFILRNGGNDATYTRFRDKLIQSLVSDRNVGEQGMEPYIVFIDGEFWGHYEVTERLSDDYIKAHYGVEKKNVSLIKNHELEEGSEESFAQWESLYEWVDNTDLSVDSNYAQLCEKVDISSFIDYMVTETYIGNQDFGINNVAWWKAETVDETNPYADGKWRFILFDTEYSTGLYSMWGSNSSYDVFELLNNKKCFVGTLLSKCLKNESFKRDFATAYLDIVNKNFDSEYVSSEVDKLSAEYHDIAVATFDRFGSNSNDWFGGGFGGGFGGIGGPGQGGTGANDQQYNSEVSKIKQFFSERPQQIQNQIRRYADLKGNIAQVTVKNDMNKGTVSVNTITPDFSGGSWTGSYFTDYPVTLSAEPVEGSTFSYWELSDGTKITGSTAEISFNNNITVTAVYDAGTVTPEKVNGDVNKDGQLSVADLVMLSKHLMGSGKLTAPENGDLCEDGKVNTYDLTEMRKLIIKKG